MKKTVLRYGLISGGIAAALMLIYSTFMEKISADLSYIVGYTLIILSSVPIYFGMVHLRDNAGTTKPSFLKYLGTGLLIALISSACYALMWTILYYTVFPDFMEKYAAQMIEHAKKAGKSAEEIKNTITKTEEFKSMYKTPFSVFAWTLVFEPLPVGILVSLISAIAISLKKNGNK